MDLNSLNIVPSIFSRYCEIKNLKKDKTALLHSPYLIAVKNNPHNMTWKLARSLCRVVPGLSQKLFDRACAEHNKEEATLLLRFLWLQEQIKEFVEVDARNMP